MREIDSEELAGREMAEGQHVANARGTAAHSIESLDDEERVRVGGVLGLVGLEKDSYSAMRIDGVRWWSTTRVQETLSAPANALVYGTADIMRRGR